MQTLILPGYSKENKTWVDMVANNLDIGGMIRPFYWAHWSDSIKEFDSSEKAELIVKHLKGDDISIIAKSFGTLIASKVYLLIPNQVKKIIMCGIPVNDFSEDEMLIVKNCLSSNKEDFACFQNSNDPHGSFDQVKSFGNIKYFESDNHDYPYYSEFQKFLTN